MRSPRNRRGRVRQNFAAATGIYRQLSRNRLIPIAFLLAGGLPEVTEMLNPVATQLERYLDLLSVRQSLVTSNIANVDTPGYQTKDIDFVDELRRASGSPEVLEAGGLVTKNDGNNVSLDRESRLLAENALRFQAASGLLRAQIQQVRSAIKEGQGS